MRTSIHALLSSQFALAIAEVSGQPAESLDPQIRAAGDAKFGDYQCNAAMALAKQLAAKPRDIAERIKAAVEPKLAGVIGPVEIAGPGFLNIRLLDSFLSEYLGEIRTADGDEAGDRVGLPRVEKPRRVVVEYSQPNIAKQMHVGHLRSTIIGDVFARVLAFIGHDVVRQNHIGDWGTQFGMLIRWYRDHPLPAPETHADVIEAIEADYRATNERDKADPQFAREARDAVAQLQGGDAAARRLWDAICKVSWDAFTQTYERLGVLLTREDVRGESFYNPQLADVVAELRKLLPPREERPAGGRSPSAEGPSAEGRGAEGPGAEALGAGGARGWSEVRNDQGAVCVFQYNADGTPRYKTAEDQPLPLIIQKSDGAFLYATTDLAAIRFRLRELTFSSGVGAERVIYVTDARQKLHFEMFLAVARDAGWVRPEHEIDHVTFGSVLGADRKPLKTRAGGTIKLRELLDEAEKRAMALLESRAGDAGPATFSDEERAAVARAVGVASIKYADLRNDRNADYVFDWDKMIALQGNTAPYMMYAYARIRSIYRKAAESVGGAAAAAASAPLIVSHPAERALMLRLSRLHETIDVLARELLPHVLCGYLYELAGDFMRFYESCPVIDAPDDATRLSRMRLSDLTARTLRLGLGLLGIDVIERM